LFGSTMWAPQSVRVAAEVEPEHAVLGPLDGRRHPAAVLGPAADYLVAGRGQAAVGPFRIALSSEVISWEYCTDLEVLLAFCPRSSTADAAAGCRAR
jgi:hypothetical protein